MKTKAEQRIEKEIFEAIQKLAYDNSEYKCDAFHAYLINYDGGTRYRVDCCEHGSFETTEHEGEEQYNPITNEWECITGFWYDFDGHYHNDYPDMKIEIAIKILS